MAHRARHAYVNLSREWLWIWLVPVIVVVGVTVLTIAFRPQSGGRTVSGPPAFPGDVGLPLPSYESPMAEPPVSASPVSAGVPPLAPPLASPLASPLPLPRPSPSPQQPTAGTPSPTGKQQPNTSYGPYLLFNARTGKCANVPGTGSGTIDGPVNQFTCIGGSADNQMWNVINRGQRGDGRYLYSISNAKDGLCLDLPGLGPADAGTSVTEFHCRGAEDNQFFYFSPRSDGTTWLVNDKSDLCLDVSGSISRDNNAPLTLYTCSDNDDHNWQLR